MIRLCSVAFVATMMIGACGNGSGSKKPYDDSAKLEAAMASGRVVVVDVRSVEEYQSGHIPGALNIPHTEIAAHLSQLPKDRDLVLYCQRGRRSQLALETLTASGYTRVYNFGGVGDFRGPLEK